MWFLVLCLDLSLGETGETERGIRDGERALTSSYVLPFSPSTPASSPNPRPTPTQPCNPQSIPSTRLPLSPQLHPKNLSQPLHLHHIPHSPYSTLSPCSLPGAPRTFSLPPATLPKRQILGHLCLSFRSPILPRSSPNPTGPWDPHHPPLPPKPSPH
uniref:Uncharacterized protein n=1 Tax=Equus asinus TaxID=9793 RepID=A0A9L0JLA8_EQUAS